MFIFRVYSNVCFLYHLVPAGPPSELRYENLTSTSFTVLWQPPPLEDQNGAILNYKINFTELSTHNYSLSYTNLTSHEVEMLDPFTSYVFSIAAATAVGFGPLSRHFLVATEEDGMLCACNYCCTVILSYI